MTSRRPRADRDASRLEHDRGIVVGLFAGGLDGWDAAGRSLGFPSVGIEWDDAACATRRAAGLPTIQADVAELDPRDFAPVWGMTGGPPCQPFSAAGKGAGRAAIDVYADAIARMAYEAKPVPRAELDEACADERAHLVLEPLRWALAIRPRWIALEQVDAVLPLWRSMAAGLRSHGYHTWTGLVTAEQFGTPQTRKRALLLASLDHAVGRPAASHQRYVAPRTNSRARKRPRDTLSLLEGTAEDVAPGHIVHPADRHLPRWVSMAEALGWGMTARPVNTITATNGDGGGPRPMDGGSGARELLRRARAAGDWIELDSRGQRDTRTGKPVLAPRRSGDKPAPCIAAASRSDAWVLRASGNTKGGQRPDGLTRPADAPAFALTTRADQCGFEPSALVHGNQYNATVRAVDEPAATLLFGKTAGEHVAWVSQRPATTIVGDARCWPPGHKQNASDPEGVYAGRAGEDAIRLEVFEALVLQGFPADWPVQGTRTKCFQQVGNAFPPQPACAALVVVLGASRVDAGRVPAIAEQIRPVSIDAPWI